MPRYNDLTYMRRALKLADKGKGSVSPNPRVGAVIVNADGKIIGEGYHAKYGEDHAEVRALKAARGKLTADATIYVTLEPCCHHGKTPPCAEAIAQAGIKRVVVATTDPNPKVNGKGIEYLTKAGVTVEVGLLEDQARYENRGYFSHRTRHRAWCAAKIALSLDGKMANPESFSKWITCEAARKLAHTFRADHDGILVGGGTVRNDNPELTVRMTKGSHPTRFILSPNFGIPHGSHLARTVKEVPTYLLTTENSKPQGLDIDGLNVVTFPENSDGRIDPVQILQKLPRLGILSLMIEGGSQVLSSFMAAGMIDELFVVYAPSVIGVGISPFESFKPESWDWKPRYTCSSIKRVGSDLAVQYTREGYPFLLD